MQEIKRCVIVGAGNAGACISTVTNGNMFSHIARRLRAKAINACQKIKQDDV
jgi:hypothetical protein